MKGPKNESISYLVKTRFQWGCDHSLLLVLHVTLKEEHTCTILINQNSLQMKEMDQLFLKSQHGIVIPHTRCSVRLTGRGFQRSVLLILMKFTISDHIIRNMYHNCKL